MQLKSEIDEITDLRNGVEDVFSRLFLHYQQSLLYLSKSIVGDLFVAEEIVSDVIVKLWLKRESFYSMISVKAFLYISVKNASINHVRSKKNLKTIEFSKEHERFSSEGDSLIKIIESEFLNEIFSEIKKLPEKQRLVLQLTYLESMNTEEICAILNMTPNAVFVNRARAIEKLKNRFKNNPLIISCLTFFLLQN